MLEAVADKLGIEVSDDEIRAELRDADESDEDIDAFFAEGGADRVRDDIRLKRGARPDRGGGQADRPGAARGARIDLDAGEGATGRVTETVDPRELGAEPT